MYRVLISISSFSIFNKLPIKLLKKNNVDIVFNEKNRKLTESELISMASDCDAIIAGTETISQNVINSAKKLKIISRVGIGVDNIDLKSAKKNNIKISYTPDLPSTYLAEMTIGTMIVTLRNMHLSNSQMHNSVWSRKFGKSIKESTIGIIGLGRIGQEICKKLESLEPKKVLAYDIIKNSNINYQFFEWSDLDRIYNSCDIITLHMPLNKNTHNFIKKEDLLKMKSDAIIINNSRGGIIDEESLYEVLKSGHLGGAALDVFESEPYNGKLTELENCFLTSHIGSMTYECRAKMEMQATEDVIRCLNNDQLINEFYNS